MTECHGNQSLGSPILLSFCSKTLLFGYKLPTAFTNEVWLWCGKCGVLASAHASVCVHTHTHTFPPKSEQENQSKKIRARMARKPLIVIHDKITLKELTVRNRKVTGGQPLLLG